MKNRDTRLDLAVFSDIFLKNHKKMEMYWITRLDAIKEGLEIMFAISTITAVFTAIGALIACETPTILKPIKRLLTASTIVAVIAGIGYTLTPTVKEAMIIHGYNTFKGYYNNNETLQRMPDKLILYLDSILTTKTKEEGN